MSDSTKDRTITALLIVGVCLLFIVLDLGLALWGVRREAGVQRQIIADMQRDDETYLATMETVAASRDAYLAEVGRLQLLLDTSQDDRTRLLSELGLTQTERDLLLDVYNTLVSASALSSESDPLDCWPVTSSPVSCPIPGEGPVLDEGEEAIVWCLDAGSAVGRGLLASCVEMYLTPYP